MVEFVRLPPNQFEKIATDIIEQAQKKGIVLRILGALAIYIHSSHCAECRDKHMSLDRLGAERPMFTDLDLMVYSSQSNLVRKFFEQDLKFKPNPYVNALFSTRRNIFVHPDNIFHVDVFYDALEFSHTVNFGTKPGGRLELDYPTITLEDIVLEKLQIHKINRKDLVDLIVLFMGHELSERSEREKINKSYISKILADDWGFWYDATNNIKKVLSQLDTFIAEGKVPPEEGNVVKNRINELQVSIDQEPKTKNWIKRSKKGTAKIWYNEVEEIER